MEMGTAEDPDHSTLGRALESIFRKIESSGNPVLLAIDEMLELLLALGNQLARLPEKTRRRPLAKARRTRARRPKPTTFG
jgi:hypothetical protein